MDLTQLANLGEFIGGVAVLVTLVYLITQVKQSNFIWREQVLRESTRASTEMMGRASADELGTIARAFRDPASVTEDERRMAGARFIAVVNYYETLFYAHRRGEVEPEHWESRQARMASYMGPARDTYWPMYKALFGKTFQAFIDTLLDPEVPAPVGFWGDHLET